jgi:hypothetical protein
LEKEKPKTGDKKEPTPFEKFDRLAKKIVQVPKDDQARERDNARRSN